MNITNLYNALNTVDSKILGEIFLEYIISDINRINQSISQLDQCNGIIEYNRFDNELIVGSKNFFTIKYNFKNNLGNLIQRWDDDLVVIEKKVKEYCEITTTYYDKYLKFGYSIERKLNEYLSFSKLKIRYSFKSRMGPCLFFKLSIDEVCCEENNYKNYGELKIYIPLYINFKKFDQEKFLENIKREILKALKDNILYYYSKTKKLSLNEKYCLVHIANKTNDFELAKKLYERRSNLPKHLKEMVNSVMIVNKLMEDNYAKFH